MPMEISPGGEIPTRHKWAWNSHRIHFSSVKWKTKLLGDHFKGKELQPVTFLEDSIAIGAFHAMQKGILGLGVNDFVTTSTLTPLIFGGNATISTVDDGSRCVLGSLDKKLVEGKIVLQGELSDARGPLEAGAQGTVMATNITQDDAGSYLLPATVISNIPDLLRIALYLRTTRLDC
ncbi:hypothetical protein IFM89_039787 [Coptis chinensis]|uniref:Uncharacterized protein n=1 Tax=Coptis chinensis TaxID=261450 RepID=A0A835GXF4_9MAGN|nr:hypothetical protein IFM89_039787 [Coptis chinensis]